MASKLSFSGFDIIQFRFSELTPARLFWLLPQTRKERKVVRITFAKSWAEMAMHECFKCRCAKSCSLRPRLRLSLTSTWGNLRDPSVFDALKFAIRSTWSFFPTSEHYRNSGTVMSWAVHCRLFHLNSTTLRSLVSEPSSLCASRVLLYQSPGLSLRHHPGSPRARSSLANNPR